MPTNPQAAAELLPVDIQAEKLLQEFYLSPAYDPDAERPADVVEAAIGYTILALSPEHGRGDVEKLADEFRVLAEHAASFDVSSVNIPLALAWKVLAALQPAPRQEGKDNSVSAVLAEQLERLGTDNCYSDEWFGNFVRSRLAAILAALHPADRGEEVAQNLDTARFDFLSAESYDLRSFAVPTGGDDADIGWRVVGHWMADPQERTVAEVYHDDPRAAIDAAMSLSPDELRKISHPADHKQEAGR